MTFYARTLLIAALTCSSLSAATVSYYGYDSPSSSSTLFDGDLIDYIVFPQFDPTLGQLDSISYEWNLGVGGILYFQSIATGPTTLLGDWTETGTAYVGGVTESTQTTVDTNFPWPVGSTS